MQKSLLFNERGIPDSCRSGSDRSVTDALERLGIDSGSALAYLYQHLVGPFSSSGGESFSELLDIVNGDRNIVSFSEKFWEDSEAAHSLLAISEIDTMVGLFYHVETDAVYEVEFEYDWEEFVRGELKPRWTNSVDFLVDYFGEEGLPSGESLAAE